MGTLRTDNAGIELRQLVMSDDQFDSLSERTRRDLIKRVWLITTNKYQYSLGANSAWNCWLLIRKERYSPVVQDDPHVCWDNNTEVIDRWR